MRETVKTVVFDLWGKVKDVHGLFFFKRSIKVDIFYCRCVKKKQSSNKIEKVCLGNYQEQ